MVVDWTRDFHDGSLVELSLIHKPHIHIKLFDLRSSLIVYLCLSFLYLPSRLKYFDADNYPSTYTMVLIDIACDECFSRS